MQQNVILDEKSFKALSADSRVSILKNLTDRRRTLTELSQKLELGSSTIKEHCDILIGADLIKQVDEGRKWKYYELTKKGKQLIQPNLFDEVKVLIMLCLGVFVVGGFIFIFLQSANLQSAAMGAADNSAPFLKSTASEQIMGASISASAREAVTASAGISVESFALAVLIALVAGIIIGWFFTRKR
ncbi:Helix-turn-helix domain protein [uncultured archaeon]|nr:Helix-turn-helix domain protein [uncultured archaeon]